ncbi:hypothetical protein SAMN05421773_10764 [Streptomyces aidingensis]|uniref:Uncharacterized protein n=1 Tax=Streptomyces aidingensis TaxID=910347 RepID=A0A1I1MU31_9ACTN|nr:hypothetical protein SAMN05421773_10764 [Streptomyces aidingensis]
MTNSGLFTRVPATAAVSCRACRPGTPEAGEAREEAPGRG